MFSCLTFYILAVQLSRRRYPQSSPLPTTLSREPVLLEPITTITTSLPPLSSSSLNHHPSVPAKKRAARLLTLRTPLPSSHYQFLTSSSFHQRPLRHRLSKANYPDCLPLCPYPSSFYSRKREEDIPPTQAGLFLYSCLISERNRLLCFHHPRSCFWTLARLFSFLPPQPIGLFLLAVV